MKKQRLTIQYLSPSDLNPYINNPRNYEGLLPSLTEAIRRYGFCVPVLAKRDHTIIDGHARLDAAKLAQLDEVPVIFIDHLSDEEIQALRININNLASLADWDDDKLQRELADLASKFPKEEISKLTAFDSELIDSFFDTGASDEKQVNDLLGQTADTSTSSPILSYTNDVMFPVGGRLEMPVLLPTGFYHGAIPTAWIGPNTESADAYLYNYSTDSPHGIDWCRSVVSFWTADQKFERLWTHTAEIVSRFKKLGIKAAVTPDFSVFRDWPAPLRMYNMYRNLYIARYFQEADIEIVVNVSAGDANALEGFLEVVPEGATLARQLQTRYSKEERASEAIILSAMLERHCTIWLYAPDNKADEFPDLLSPKPDRVHFITPRLYKRVAKKGAF